MPSDQPAPDIDERIEHLARDTDLRAVAEVLTSQRESILDAWLLQAARQPFHVEHPEQAVADHIPQLFEAITQLLIASGPANQDVQAPLDDEAVVRAANAHAQARYEQRLGPVAIATEFRLLRQEVSRALREHLDDDLPTGDIVSSIMVVNDALDGATMIALSALTERIETVRDEFLATTLHDIRQPLTLLEGSLVLAARWLRRRPVDIAKLAETTDQALAVTQEMTHLIDTLADASRVAMGAIELEREPTHLRHVIDDAIEMLDPASQARIRVRTDDATAAVGDWDRGALRRVLTNLLTNAAKYSAPPAPIVVETDLAAGMVHIQVRDEGIGLDPAEIALLFQRYGRAESARSRGLPGLGLGLYACRGLVEGHGGRIWIESAGRDRGSTVHVMMPVEPEQPD
ncbi:MAG TPA: sensor histidine kinase [Candidatus Limnocylindria bacterium]|nr:sensor histidine kinase [Candidatus Limnocylindria bacterium]